MKFRSPTAEPIRVARTDGHVILIGGNDADGNVTWTEVPAFMVRDAVAEGAVPEGVPVDLMHAQPASNASSPAIAARIEAALVAMAEEKIDGEFTANGLPVVSVVSRRVGAKVTREDVYAVWNRLNPGHDDE
jgi:hypothetical protein